MTDRDPRLITVLGTTLDDAKSFIAGHPSLEGARPLSMHQTSKSGALVAEYFTTHAFYLAHALGDPKAHEAARALHRDFVKMSPRRRGLVGD